jgi:hypothetical protein
MHIGRILYNAQVHVVGKYLNGLLVLKTVDDTTTHVVFTNYSGITYFDFAYCPSGIRTVYVMDQLDSKKVIVFMQSLLGHVFLYHMDAGIVSRDTLSQNLYFKKQTSHSKQTYYITSPDCSQLLAVEDGGRKTANATIRFFNISSEGADSLHLQHHKFQLEIHLKRCD